jgi:hypothetical protein
MATTTLKLSENLRFKLALIAEALADQAQSLKSKKGFTHQDVFASLRARADGKKVLPLKAKPW